MINEVNLKLSELHYILQMLVYCSSVIGELFVVELCKTADPWENETLTKTPFVFRHVQKSLKVGRKAGGQDSKL